MAPNEPGCTGWDAPSLGKILAKRCGTAAWLPWARPPAGARFPASRVCRGLAITERAPPMLRVVAALLLLAISVSTPAAADTKRVALVFGMSDYQHLSKLPNPVPDAKA